MIFLEVFGTTNVPFFKKVVTLNVVSARRRFARTGPLPTHPLYVGCHNGIGGFHENLETFRAIKLPGVL